MGALWSSADGKTLYQYAGQFQDNPNVPPPAEEVFQYDIDAARWSVVETTGDEVTRPAEGSTAVVPGSNGGENVGYCQWTIDITRDVHSLTIALEQTFLVILTAIRFRAGQIKLSECISSK